MITAMKAVNIDSTDKTIATVQITGFDSKLGHSFVTWIETLEKVSKEQKTEISPFVDFLKVKSYQPSRLDIVWRTIGSKGELFRLQGRNFPRG